MGNSNIPQKVLLINLPTHIKSNITKLPEFAEKEGSIYFIDDEKGTPLGIGVSGSDKRIKFYAYMQALEADAVTIDKEYFRQFGEEADNVQDALIAIHNNDRTNIERRLSGVI